MLGLWRTVPALFATLVVGLGAAPTFAQEAIPTGAGAPLGGAPTAPPPGPLGAERKLPGGDDVVRTVNACGAPSTEDGKTDKSPHGEVFAGVGTHGYREAGGVVCVPVGDHTAVTIAVDAGRYPTWRGRP
jgi:hypothetical protein